MAEDDGIEKRSFRTVLGPENDGASTCDTYDVVVKDHGVKSGLRYDSVCITPAADSTAFDEAHEKTLQVLYTQDAAMQGKLKFATVAVCETPRKIADESTVSKVVRLRSDGPPTVEGSTSASGSAGRSSAMASELDRDLQHRDQAPATDESEGIFASDPEALKYIRFGPKPETTGALGIDESEGIFASDPEALKYIRFGPKPEATSTKDWSDPDAPKLKTQVGPEAQKCKSQDGLVPAASDPATADVAEGDLLAEATGLQLKDSRTYSVRVTGHDLPDGQQRKFVSVRSSDGGGGPTREEVDRLQVSVETKVHEDGMVEKFVVVE